MTTVLNLVNQARAEVLAGVTEQNNKLSTTIDNDDTGLSFTYALRGIQAGAVIEIEFEQMYVWEANTTAKTATVERGWNGTTAVAHTAPVLVTVHPRFTRQTMLNYLNHELDDLTSPVNGLYLMNAMDVPYNQDGRDIPLTLSPVPLSGLYAVRYRADSLEWPQVRKWELVRDGTAAEFPNGFALRMFDYPLSTGILRIQWKSEFPPVVSTSDLQTVTGGTELDEILKLGIQIRALATREVKRNFTETQPEPRRADEVAPGAVAQSMTGLMRQRRDRIIAEAARLNARYPTVIYRR